MWVNIYSIDTLISFIKLQVKESLCVLLNMNTSLGDLLLGYYAQVRLLGLPDVTVSHYVAGLPADFSSHRLGTEWALSHLVIVPNSPSSLPLISLFQEYPNEHMARFQPILFSFIKIPKFLFWNNFRFTEKMQR